MDFYNQKYFTKELRDTILLIDMQCRNRIKHIQSYQENLKRDLEVIQNVTYSYSKAALRLEQDRTKWKRMQEKEEKRKNKIQAKWKKKIKQRKLMIKKQTNVAGNEDMETEEKLENEIISGASSLNASWNQFSTAKSNVARRLIRRVSDSAADDDKIAVVRAKFESIPKLGDVVRLFPDPKNKDVSNLPSVLEEGGESKIIPKNDTRQPSDNPILCRLKREKSNELLRGAHLSPMSQKNNQEQYNQNVDKSGEETEKITKLTKILPPSDEENCSKINDDNKNNQKVNVQNQNVTQPESSHESGGYHSTTINKTKSNHKTHDGHQYESVSKYFPGGTSLLSHYLLSQNKISCREAMKSRYLRHRKRANMDVPLSVTQMLSKDAY